MNAKRITRHVGNIRTWNVELDRERTRALAEAAHRPDDHGADGRAATSRDIRSEATEVDDKPSTARRVVCECQVDTFYVREMIDHGQYQAGLWFRQRYLLGYQAAVVTAGYGERVAGGIGDGISSRVLDARHDLGQLAQLLGMMEWAAVEGVAGHDQKLGKGRLRFLKSGLDLVTLYRDATRSDGTSKRPPR